MELAFQEKNLRCLQLLAEARQCREETADVIVPDSSPDVDRILFADGTAVLRSKDCRQGSVTLTGGVRVRVMYVAEGETVPRCLETFLPYSVRADVPELNEESQVMASVTLGSAEARLVNSRKILVRAAVCWEIRAYGPKTMNIRTPVQTPDSLQLRWEQYSVLLPAETAERSFQMSEELRIPANRPLTGELFSLMPRLEITERRIAGNKAVFKGRVLLRLLYGSVDGVPAVYETELPFSQYCELQELYDEEELTLALALTGCETDLTATPEGDGLLLTLYLLAQCLVSRRENLDFCEDAYCLREEFLPQWDTCAVRTRLDRQTLSRMHRDSWNGDVSEVLELRVTPEPVQCSRMDDGVELIVPMHAQMLYYDRGGALRGAAFRTEFREQMALSPQADCSAAAAISGDVTAIPTTGGVEFRYPLLLEVECCANQEYRHLAGGELREGERRPAEKPAVIIRRTCGGEQLWDIAKANGTTVERIRSANHLDSETTAGGLLLIPT